jgi:hypothetical protein
MKSLARFLTAGLVLFATTPAWSQTPKQPKIAPGPNEPDWVVVLKDSYGLSMYGDLKNPVKTTAIAVPGLFRKAGAGPVTFVPEIALGLETVNRGGWYRPGTEASKPEKHDLWSYKAKNTTDDVKTGKNPPPKLHDGAKTTFEPGETPFGLWVSNDGLEHSDVYSQPSVVAALNPRLAKQPYKLMIYPYRDKATGKDKPNSYLLGWEYSTNDDFQDIVGRVDNVVLIEPEAKP